MTAHTFPAGATPRVIVTDCHGDLTIEAWDEREIAFESDGPVETSGQEQEDLIIHGAHDDLRLRVPGNTAVIVENQHGDVDARDISALTLQDIEGDVTIEAIAGHVRLHKIHGEVEVEDAETLVIAGHAAQDVHVHNVRNVQIERVDADLEIEQAQSIVINVVGGDCTIERVGEACRYGNIGGDLTIEGDDRTVVVGGHVGGDCAITHVQSIQLGDVGNSATVRSVAGDLRISNTGGDCAVDRVGGSTHVGNVGGDAIIRDLGADLRIGNVGGDLRLAAKFPPESVTHITVGGDVRLDLPEQPNVTIHATVGGDVSGHRLVSSGEGGVVTIVYGEGTARLELIVGGDLSLRGGSAPRVSRSAGRGWADFGEEMSRLGQELSEEMGRMSEEIEREMETTFGPWGRESADHWSRKIQQQAERMRRRIEKRMHRFDERDEHADRHANERPERVRVRINDREWRFDPERLERLKRQAQQAAQEGISGALEAVERALAGMGAPPIPPPSPLRPPVPPAAPGAPAVPGRPVTGDTVRINIEQPDQESAAPVADSAPTPTVETERTAILRMVAEGRISPEEGDMLLDALG